jgi:hypothetical protein
LRSTTKHTRTTMRCSCGLILPRPLASLLPLRRSIVPRPACQ